MEQRGDGRVVRFADGTEVTAHAVVLATGVSYTRLPAPGADDFSGRGVYYGAAAHEAVNCRDQAVYVVGAANSAGQAALHFAKFAREVIMLVRGDSLRRSMSEYLVARIEENPPPVRSPSRQPQVREPLFPRRLASNRKERLPMSILIVDDNREACNSLRSFLIKAGYADVRTAHTGVEALELLAQWATSTEKTPTDVILLDVEMPGLDGLETCRRIKAMAHSRDIPVLIVTGTPEEQAVELAFSAGACDYINKPIHVPELLARVRLALNLKREMDNCRARERELQRVTEQLNRANEELKRLSVMDELTGIANRRMFNLRLNQEWARAAREVLPLSLILVDVDFFKNYNDHYGHLQGDHCLRLVAQTLQSVVRRPGDCVARYGGEEFVILLSHTSVQGALAVAEAVRQRVEEAKLEHARSPVCPFVTISLGVATTIPARTSSTDLLVAAADQAVYEAKRNGRNRVIVYQGFVRETRRSEALALQES